MPVYTASEAPVQQSASQEIIFMSGNCQTALFAKGQSKDTAAIAAISSSLVLAELFSARLLKQAGAPEHVNHHVKRCLNSRDDCLVFFWILANL